MENITKRNRTHLFVKEEDEGELLKVPRVRKYTNNNGSSAKQLMEIAINEIRENRQEINYVKSKLMKGAGKISANRQAITDISQNVRDERKKTYLGAGGITIVLNFLKEGLMWFFAR